MTPLATPVISGSPSANGGGLLLQWKFECALFITAIFFSVETFRLQDFCRKFWIFFFALLFETVLLAFAGSLLGCMLGLGFTGFRRNSKWSVMND